MTKAEAAQLQAKWKEQGGQTLCEHRNQEMEHSDSGYLMGNFHCTECGEHLVKKLDNRCVLGLPNYQRLPRGLPSAGRLRRVGFALRTVGGDVASSDGARRCRAYGDQYTYG